MNLGRVVENVGLCSLHDALVVDHFAKQFHQLLLRTCGVDDVGPHYWHSETHERCLYWSNGGAYDPVAVVIHAVVGYCHCVDDAHSLFL